MLSIGRQPARQNVDASVKNLTPPCLCENSDLEGKRQCAHKAPVSSVFNGKRAKHFDILCLGAIDPCRTDDFTPPSDCLENCLNDAIRFSRVRVVVAGHPRHARRLNAAHSPTLSLTVTAVLLTLGGAGGADVVRFTSQSVV